jgi:hypothetical protein
LGRPGDPADRPYADSFQLFDERGWHLLNFYSFFDVAGQGF